MSRSIVRPLLAGLALALLLAVPVHAAGRHEHPPAVSISALLPQWVVSLLEKIGMHVDPNGAAAPAGGTSTSNDSGASSDIGWHIDPDG